jgi:phosphoglycolate phosphatase-like HAD superfamily hydrolase
MIDNVHISFDLDGTLIDSIPLMKLSWENVNTVLNLGIGWEVYRKNIGLPFSAICKNLSIERIESEVRDLYFRFNQGNVDKIKPMGGLKECIEWMDESSISWSIITSKPKITTDPILELFDLNPKVIITADDVENGKPRIDSSLLLTSQLSDKVNKIYYVGDTTIDHLFAINSGFEFIEFNQLTESRYILNNRPVVSKLSDIKNFIRKN